MNCMLWYEYRVVLLRRGGFCVGSEECRCREEFSRGKSKDLLKRAFSSFDVGAELFAEIVDWEHRNVKKGRERRE